MKIEIKVNEPLSVEQVAMLYRETEFAKPLEDNNRLQEMINHTPLVFSAWNEEKLLGFARCLTDFEYFCYLSDILVLPYYQKQGIGKMLVHEMKEYLGSRVTISLRAEDKAQGFYEQMNFEQTDKMYRIKRVG
ncbi:N-acetyltransferase [Tetragenococcus osmophilus]|uniref:N-acetyltransferase n=1 Tax=Tetragenococcus osmophilus TaxID=526944 RepID=A0AA37XL72_9ENTE|nr:GNAT family N-acetyltransferase [Tetragenococcus osmophilus]AYW47560.1 N-acetyltransferase [Tetragenococcus osmophilus]GMA53178.1 N-acetyltransferase [Alicyclobacillus contaminans]GMA72847.1 N-acetyltransferase [Tetragenococcus osmophilus]